jgi:hypothetical protein
MRIRRQGLENAIGRLWIREACRQGDPFPRQATVSDPLERRRAPCELMTLQLGEDSREGVGMLVTQELQRALP